MSRRGRPPATYAESYLDVARRNSGDWFVFVLDDPDEALKVARKIRRDNSGDVRTLTLSDELAVLAVRTVTGGG